MRNTSIREVRIYTRSSKGYRTAFFHDDQWITRHEVSFFLLEVPDWEKKGESAFFIVRVASPAELIAFSFSHLSLFSLDRDMDQPPFMDEIKMYPLRLWKEPEHEDGSFSTKERAIHALQALCERAEQALDAPLDGIFPFLEERHKQQKHFQVGDQVEVSLPSGVRTFQVTEVFFTTEVSDELTVYACADLVDSNKVIFVTPAVMRLVKEGL